MRNFSDTSIYRERWILNILSMIWMGVSLFTVYDDTLFYVFSFTAMAIINASCYLPPNEVERERAMRK